MTQTVTISYGESIERGQRETQRIQQLIDSAGRIFNYISGTIPTTAKINSMKEDLQHGILHRGHFEEQG